MFNFSGLGWDLEHIHVFSETLQLSKVRSLWLHWNNIGDDAVDILVKALLKGPRLIRCLLLHKNSIGGNGANTLAQAFKHLSSLSMLTLAANPCIEIPEVVDEMVKAWASAGNDLTRLVL